VNLENLPAGWDTTKVRWLFHISSGDQISASEETDKGYPLVGGNGVRGRVPGFNTRPPLLIVGRVGALCGNVHEFNEPVWATEHALRLRPRSDFDLRFLRYSLEAKSLRHLAVGSAQPVIAASRLGEERIPLPLMPVQRAIASFLDRETARIDTLTQKKRRLLDLLEEKRTALITRAVTRGLDPTVPMKDSGVEWIGAIPEHWEVVLLDKLVQRGRRITYGIVQPGSPDPEGRLMVRGQDYSRGWARAEAIFRVSNAIERLYMRARLKGGDLIVTIVGAGTGNVAVVPDWLDGANITQTTARVAPDDSIVDRHFLRRTLESDIGRTNVDLAVKGAAQPGLNLGHLAKFRIPLPPRDEQQEIAVALEAEIMRLENVRGRTRDAIDLLEEYRTALISAAVTGKIEVREKDPRMR
jgi:type I restriction enzyme, S subunit